MSVVAWSPLDKVQAAFSPKAALRRGTALVAAGKTRKAFRLLARAARSGCAEAEYRVGLCYVEGTGVPASLAEGVRWLERAADRGHVAAQLLMAGICLHGSPARSAGAPGGGADLVGTADQGGPDYVAAIRWARRAAEHGCAEAQALLGFMLTTGSEHLRNPDEAGRWHARSATAGSPQADLDHAIALAHWGGDEALQHEVVMHLRKAAEAELPAALYLLGVASQHGFGVAPDQTEAAAYYRRAAERGHRAAQLQWGLALARGAGVPENASEGQTWLRRAALGGDPQAAAALGDLYACDGGLPANELAAHERRRAAEAGQMDGHPISPAATADRPGNADELAARRVEGIDRSSTEEAVDPQPASCPCGSGLRSDRCCDLDAGYPVRADVRGQLEPLLRRAREAFATGDVTAAESLCIHVLNVDPRVPDALWMLCQIRGRADNQRAARSLLRRLVAIDPNHLDATLELASLLFQRGDMASAEPLARNAVRLAPTHPRSHKLMAMVLTEGGRPRPGEYHYRRAIELSGTADPILQANLAWNLKCQGKIGEARRLYEESVKAAPDVFQTWLGWGRLEEAERDFAAARLRLEQAARIRPNDPALRLERAVLRSREGDDLAALAELEPPDARRDRDGACAAETLNSYALLEKGRILDRLQRYDEAFACFAEAKRREREASGIDYYDRQAQEAAKRLRQFFVGGRVRLFPAAPAVANGAQPIFILGFPRSGTTLVEQALSNHPRISAGDELPFINEFSEIIPRLLGSPLSYPEALSELWVGDSRHGLGLLRDVYLRKADARGVVEPGSAWFTDKMPLNEMHLGLITVIFPCSPLIHVLRHPLDVILSAFSHHLTHGYFCALALETVARHYVLVMELVEHYRTEMALRYLTVRYEDMVEDIAGSVRRMLDFIGEPFDLRCVSFHRNGRLPQTPSYAQVAEPLYDRSKFRYRHYLKHLEPVIPIVAPIISRLGYSLD
jgi:TPR repeat protein/Tfp pilus assembly protein PilF